MSVKQQYFTTPDAAKFMGRSRRWIEKQLADGVIKKRFLGSRIGITREQLESLIREEPEKSHPRRFE